MKPMSSLAKNNRIRNSFMLAAALLFAASAAATATAQTIQVSKENRTIAVTATDKAMAMADTATVHVGFIDYGPDSASAYATGSRISNAIMDALTGAGIPKDAIESENQNVSPVQPYQVEKLSEAERAKRQFQVTQSWTVRVPANDAAKTLDLAVKAGANQSGQIDWSLKNEDALQAEAAAKALKHARAQAEQMAQSLDTKLGALLYASNQVEAVPPRPLMMRAMAAPAAEPAPLAINPRQVEKIATVYAVFAIE